MEKRYRDRDGRLTIKLEELVALTKEDGLSYYKEGETYRYGTEDRVYVCLEIGEDIIKFISGSNELSIDKHSCGTFLPDIASEGMALTKV